MNKELLEGSYIENKCFIHNILKTGVTKIGRNLENKEIW